MRINTKLEQTLGLAPMVTPDEEETDEGVSMIDALNEKPVLSEYVDFDKIDAALPSVRGLEASDAEMDELAATAISGYKDLMDLGMNVEIRYASEIFGAASSLLGHAITAKTKKIDKKLKMVDLQLKKLRIEKLKDLGDDTAPEATEKTRYTRNELLAEIVKQTRPQIQKP